MTVLAALRHHKLLVATVVLVLLATLIAPVFAADGTRTLAASFSPPAPGLLLGTDGLGRDVFARLLSGGRDLVLVAAVSTVVAICVGAALGIFVAHPGVVSAAARWILDAVLVVPAMLTMMVLVFGLGAGLTTVILITAAVSAPFVARFVRSLVLPLRGSEFVLAARNGGDASAVVMVREVLPVIAGPIAADAGARFVGAVYLVASASFLGFDPLGADADWASAVQTGLQGLSLNPWAVLAPAGAIAAVTVPANLLVDRLIREVSR